MKLNHYVSAVILSAMITSTFAVTTTDDVVPNAAVSALSVSKNLIPLTDNELAEQTGQALLNLSYLAPGDANNPASNNSSGTNTGFYTLSMEATVAMNVNIKNLQLGCGGINGANGCDIDAQNVSFGCIADASGTCTSLAAVTQSNGVVQKPGAVLGSAANQKQMRDFVLTNPFIQFAIKNPTSASTREVIGVRLGAANVTGPLSFGAINMFSGYLTGLANVELRGQGPGRGNLAIDEEDVAITCGASTAPCAGPRPGTGENTFGLDGYRTLGLDNDEACVLFICAEFKDLTASFTGIKRSNRVATVNGSRQTQAFIANLNLGKGTNGGEDGVVRTIVDTLEIERSNASLSEGLINAIIGLIKGQARDKITAQLADGLGTTVASLDNNTYLLPYSLQNVHQLEVNSSTFGLTLSKQDLQYPGFVAQVQRGWGMYMPDAFTLNISDKTTVFVQNIASSSAARDGNIVGLEPPFRNCYGSLKFC